MSNAIDLSDLPPEIRQKVEQQLARLPPAAREKILREGGPMVRKLVGKLQAAAGGPPPLPGAGQHGSAWRPPNAAANVQAAKELAADAVHKVSRLIPKGHFNETIRPGDRPGSGRWLLIVLVAAVLAAAFWGGSDELDLRGADAVDERIEIEPR